ncbi:MAG TPA: rod shape-determining protein MreC [Firmicutes bacterium]|nr:rod shape-determining protein MreC [Candidatus Fermentithermobacillaceae bacterium]
MRRLFPYKKLITVTLLVAASVFLMNITGSSQDSPSFWERLLWKGMQPCLETFLAARQKFQDYRALFQSKKDLLEENREIKRRMDSLEALLTRLHDVQNENQRLRELLGFREQLDQEYKAADVIGRSPGKWFSTITISLGSEDGVTIDAPVISRRGLVGRVIKLDTHSAGVLLLTDPESGVGSLISRSRDYGIVVGGSGPDTLVMRFFSRDADVYAGDEVLTSGVGSVYPAGLFIGEVTEVYVPKPGLVKECYIKPAVDFAHLEEVLVMIK